MKYCPYEKYLYCLDNADEISIRRQKETRSGIDNSEDEFEEIDEIIYKTVVEQKQSIHHCLVANKDKIKKSEKTIYNWIDEGILKTKNIDLPRKTGFKIRKHKIPDKYDYNHKKDIDRTGRFHSDWIVYKSINHFVTYFEMDFLGKPFSSSKEILVLSIPEISFVLLYLIKDTTTEKVKTVFDTIENEIGTDNFKILSPAILTDRDTVFDDFSKIEVDDNREIRTHIFFCDPGVSNQKPYVENINAQLRTTFPKKSILNEYTQDEINFACSNLNSRFLNSIYNKTPYGLLISIFGEELAAALHITKIDPKNVSLKPIHK